MKSITQEFLELKIAALASKKISGAEIKEVTKDAATNEQSLSALQKLMTERGVPVTVESAEAHYSQKADDLLEKLSASGKVQPFQIMESVSGCSNAKERFEALQSLALAKHVVESKRIERKNGSRVMAESDRQVKKGPESEQIARVAKNMRMTIREATIYVTGRDPGASFKESGDAIAERAARWKQHCGFLSEQECRQLAEKGLEP
jgi:hypothetical protein